MWCVWRIHLQSLQVSYNAVLPINDNKEVQRVALSSSARLDFFSIPLCLYNVHVKRCISFNRGGEGDERRAVKH